MVPELRSAFAGQAKSVSQAPSLRKREPVKLSIGLMWRATILSSMACNWPERRAVKTPDCSTLLSSVHINYSYDWPMIARRVPVLGSVNIR